MDKTIAPDGIDLVFLNMPVEETFFRMLRHREFDIAEMSLSSYVMSCFPSHGHSWPFRCSRRVSSGIPRFT